MEDGKPVSIDEVILWTSTVYPSSAKHQLSKGLTSLQSASLASHPALKDQSANYNVARLNYYEELGRLSFRFGLKKTIYL